jgi:hypothetical protein
MVCYRVAYFDVNAKMPLVPRNLERVRNVTEPHHKSRLLSRPRELIARCRHLSQIAAVSNMCHAGRVALSHRIGCSLDL